MRRVRLLHWKAQEAAAHIEILSGSKYQVEYDEQFGSDLTKKWRASPPDAFVIDLSRLPSHGREIARALRQSPRTRFVPIVFCGGTEEKVRAIRTLLPDAAYCSLPELSRTLESCLTKPPLNPVKPPAMMELYRTRTAAQKLGIVEGSTVSLVNPPSNVLRMLGELPPSVEFLEDSHSGTLVLYFADAVDALRAALPELRQRAATSKLWIVWRKGGSAARGDLTERLIRETALDLGLVDYKICSVDSTWTAMLFAKKR